MRKLFSSSNNFWSSIVILTMMMVTQGLSASAQFKSKSSGIPQTTTRVVNVPQSQRSYQAVAPRQNRLVRSFVPCNQLTLDSAKVKPVTRAKSVMLSQVNENNSNNKYFGHGVDHFAQEGIDWTMQRESMTMNNEEVHYFVNMVPLPETLSNLYPDGIIVEYEQEGNTITVKPQVIGNTTDENGEAEYIIICSYTADNGCIVLTEDENGSLKTIDEEAICLGRWSTNKFDESWESYLGAYSLIKNVKYRLPDEPAEAPSDVSCEPNELVLFAGLSYSGYSYNDNRAMMGAYAPTTFRNTTFDIATGFQWSVRETNASNEEALITDNKRNFTLDTKGGAVYEDLMLTGYNQEAASEPFTWGVGHCPNNDETGAKYETMHAYAGSGQSSFQFTDGSYATMTRQNPDGDLTFYTNWATPDIFDRTEISKIYSYQGKPATPLYITGVSLPLVSFKYNDDFNLHIKICKCQRSATGSLTVDDVIVESDATTENVNADYDIGFTAVEFTELYYRDKSGTKKNIDHLFLEDEFVIIIEDWDNGTFSGVLGSQDIDVSHFKSTWYEKAGEEGILYSYNSWFPQLFIGLLGATYGYLYTEDDTNLLFDKDGGSSSIHVNPMYHGIDEKNGEATYLLNIESITENGEKVDDIPVWISVSVANEDYTTATKMDDEGNEYEYFVNGIDYDLVIKAEPLPWGLENRTAQIVFYQTGAKLTVTITQNGTDSSTELEKVNGVYQIRTAANLKAFAELVNNGEVNANAVLTADIALTSEWETPIGVAEATAYTGIFDGQGHKISGFNGTSSGQFGLFGCTNGATIKNFSIDGTLTVIAGTGSGVVGYPASSTISNVHSTLKVAVTEGATHHVGGVVGSARGGNTISGCTFAGSMTVVAGNSDIFSGVVGYLGGDSVSFCANYGTISFEDVGCAAGGIAGYLNNASSYVQNCLNMGSVACSEEGATPTYGGAIVGRLRTYDTTKLTGDCWLEGSAYGGGCDGGSDKLAATCFTTDKLATGEICYALNGDQSEIGWYQTLGTDEAPVLDSTHKQVYMNGRLHCNGDVYEGAVYSNENTGVTQDDHNIVDGFCTYCGLYDENYLTPNADGFYEIATARQLMWFEMLVNKGTLNANAILTADIDFADVMPEDADPEETQIEWTPIGDWGATRGTSSAGYKGHFDGQGHTIKNLNATSKQNYFGLFGVISTGCLIENFTISGTYYTTYQYAGSVAAYARDSYPTIRGIHSYVNINNSSAGGRQGGILGGVLTTVDKTIIENCTYSGILDGNDTGGSGSYGGIVGYVNNNGATVLDITNCLFDGQVVNNNSAPGGCTFGGFVGYSNGGVVTIKNSLSIGHVESAVWGQFFGAVKSTMSSLPNSYYMGKNLNGSASTVTLTANETNPEELASGRICYLLNGDQSEIGWYQTLGEDDYPIPDNNHLPVLYTNGVYINGDISNIVFADANVKALCVANWDTNSDGELSYAEAAAVTDLGDVFRYNTTITSFNELQYFTGLEYISDCAFYECTGLKSVAIPEGVTTIGDGAFQYCFGLTSINIPKSVITIGVQAFLGCRGFTSVTIPDGVTTIGACAFSGCSNLTDVVIPKSVISIGYAAFADTPWDENLPNGLIYLGPVAYKYKGAMPENTSIVIKGGTTQLASQIFYSFKNLTSITIPEGVIDIGDEAFKDCIGLTSITIPESMASISASAFNGCSGLTSIEVKKGNTVYDSRNDCNAIIETASNTLITGCMNSTIPEGITSIGLYAFWDCKCLTSITIPESVTSIGNYSFWGCSSLTSITIPKNVTTIGYDAFTECSGLATISVDNNNPQYDSRGNCNAIIKTGTNTLIVGCSTTIIPDDVTDIGLDAFRGRSGLTSITIPNSVTSIEDQAFVGCYGLSSVYIPGSVTYIGGSAFGWCGLTSVAIPNSITYISEFLFQYCTSLSSIIIGNNVTNIGDRAFLGCRRMSIFKVGTATPPIVSSSAFQNSNYKNATLYVPAGSKAAYKAADYWKDFKEIIDMGQSIAFEDDAVKAICVANWDTNSDGELSYAEAAAVTDLGEVFKHNYEITSFDELQYFTGLTSIGEFAFYCCSGLTSITIPESVTEIDYCAFHSCIGLTSITIPNNVTSIDAAFNGCNGLTSIFIPKNVTSIDGSFDACSGLESIVVEEGNTVYDSRNNCNALIETASNTLIRGCKNTIIPESITTIGFSAFTQCYGLTSITIPNSVTSIENSAFYGCSNLTSISIPNSVDNIGEFSFGYCGRLESIVVDGGNTVYDSRNNCNALIETASNTLIRGCKNTIIPEGITTIGSSAFSACDGITSVTLPNSVTSICELAFGNCFNLTSITIPKNVVIIARLAFDACSSLTSITIPEKVTTIGESAFSWCRSLTNVISKIEEPFAFGNGAFDDISDNCMLTVPAGTRDAYIAAGWTADVFKGGIVEDMGTMTDISQMDNAIYVEPMEGKKGDIVPLEVKLKNAITPVGCSFKLRLPEGFSLVKDTDGDVIYEIGDRAKKMSVTMQDWNNGSFDFALTPSTGTATISGNDGTFITFSLKVPDDAVANQNYRIQLTNNLVQSKQDGVTQDTPLSDVRTNLYVFDYILGDVNGDKKVTPSDAIMILYHYFNVEQNGFNAKAADLNKDGNISPADAIEALYIYFGVGNSNAVKAYIDTLDLPDVLDPQ